MNDIIRIHVGTAKPSGPLDLDAIEARARAATGGPWRLEADAGLGQHGVVGVAGLAVGSLEFGAGEEADADREFVIAARTDVPLMAAEIRRLRAELAEHRDQVLTEAAEMMRRSNDAISWPLTGSSGPAAANILLAARTPTAQEG